MQLSTVNGIELSLSEWRDALFLQYGLDPPDLPHYCDGCNAHFSVCCNCKRGGLVTERHNEFSDGVTDLAGKAFTSSHVRNNPLIFEDCAAKRPKAKPNRSKGTTVPDNAPPL